MKQNTKIPNGFKIKKLETVNENLTLDRTRTQRSIDSLNRIYGEKQAKKIIEKRDK